MQKVPSKSSKGRFPPYKHFNKMGHPPFKWWRRHNVKCNKCNELRHEYVICINKMQHQEKYAKIANEEEEDQFFCYNLFSSNISSESWLIDS